MNRFNISLVAERLTAYAIERQNGPERYQPPDVTPWQDQRRLWADAILQGMAGLDGRAPVPELMDWYDQRLDAARSCAAAEPLPPAEQAALIRDLRQYTAALEATSDDRRRQVAVVEALMQDMMTHRPWDACRKEVSEMIQLTSDMLMRMTAQLPIRFTYVTLSGSLPSCVSDFVSGTVKDVEAVKATELYQKVNQWNPKAMEWLASCSVYVGGNADTDCATDADAFDMSIIRSDEYRFLKQPGIRHVETQEWTIPVYENILLSPSRKNGH